MADADPAASTDVTRDTFDPLAAIRTGVRADRTGPSAEQDNRANAFTRFGRHAPPSPMTEPHRSAGWRAAPASPEPSVLEGLVLRLGRNVVVHVQAQVAEQYLQDAQHARSTLAPHREVGELPPPQGLQDPALLEMA